jgi:hypothetical protein
MNNNQSSRTESRWVDRQHNIDEKDNTEIARVGKRYVCVGGDKVGQIHRPVKFKAKFVSDLSMQRRIYDSLNKS